MNTEALLATAAAVVMFGMAVYERVQRVRASGKTRSLHQEGDDATARTLKLVTEERDELARQVERQDAKLVAVELELAALRTLVQTYRAELIHIPNSSSMESKLDAILTALTSIDKKLTLPGGLMDLETRPT